MAHPQRSVAGCAAAASSSNGDGTPPPGAWKWRSPSSSAEPRARPRSAEHVACGRRGTWWCCASRGRHRARAAAAAQGSRTCCRSRARHRVRARGPRAREVAYAQQRVRRRLDQSSVAPGSSARRTASIRRVDELGGAAQRGRISRSCLAVPLVAIGRAHHSPACAASVKTASVAAEPDATPPPRDALEGCDGSLQRGAIGLPCANRSIRADTSVRAALRRWSRVDRLAQCAGRRIGSRPA